MVCQQNSLWITIFILLSVLHFPGYESNSVNTHSLRHRSHSGTNDTEDTTTTTKIPRVAEMFVKPQEDVRLSCYLPQLPSESPGFGISWLHNGLLTETRDAGSTTGHRYTTDSVSGQLIITNIRLEDDGVWQCQFFDDTLARPLLSKPMKLVILDKPHRPYLLIDSRRLDAGNSFVPVKENSELTVTCVVEGGNPAPSIKWVLIPSNDLDPSLYNEDRYLNVALNVTENTYSEDNRVHAHAHIRSEAKLDNVRRVHHNATFYCIAQHMSLGTPLNASLLLDVQYSPSFAISREPGFGFPLREGVSVSLKCDVDSNPSSAPVWQKDDGSPPVVQSIDGYLNFTAIKREHSGWYKCTSHHLLGDFSSIGYFLNVRNDINVTQDPLLESYPTGRQVDVPLGGAVQLQCPEEAMGCWSRVGVNGKLEPVGPGPGLTLSNILYQDAGEYRCVSSKRGELDRWRSEVNVDVTVKGRPVVYPSETSISAFSGQELEFSVEFCANPPPTKTYWVTDTQKLTPGQQTNKFIAHNITVGSSIHCFIATLTVRRVQISSGGEYMFLVRSPNGVTGGFINVNVSTVGSYGYSGAAPTCCVLYQQLLLLLLYMTSVGIALTDT